MKRTRKIKEMTSAIASCDGVPGYRNTSTEVISSLRNISTISKYQYSTSYVSKRNPARARALVFSYWKSRSEKNSTSVDPVMFLNLATMSAHAPRPSCSSSAWNSNSLSSTHPSAGIASMSRSIRSFARSIRSSWWRRALMAVSSSSSLAASSLSASSCSSCSSSVVSSACPRKWIRHWRLSFSSLPRSSSSFLTCCSMSPCDSAISSRLYGCGWSVLRSLTFSCAAAVPRHATRFWKKQRFCWILCSIPQ
mmetsp:Transcript_49449/g.117366  ORF Transcript_49449/g.117366 Transcript_49449/m.117366 type:complete len:251 (+) Transcript_49449:18-770(+)